MTRQVNAAALAIATASEGCVLTGYRDPSGIPTAGYGHTGKDVVVGKTYTMAQALAWRDADMARAAAFVEAHVKVPLTDNQFGALAEFTYNVGVGNFLGSTLRKKLNAGDYAAVPAELARWTKAGGRTLAGLIDRRQREAALFATSQSDIGIPTAAGSICKSPPEYTDPIPKPSPPSLIERLRAWWHDHFGAAAA